jgi:hypothetical protein
VLITDEHGCIEHNTIKTIKNKLIWVSSDGLCLLSGNTIEVITKDKLNKVIFSPVAATVYNEQYMLVVADGSIFIMDLRFNALSFKYYKYANALVYNLGKFNNRLYGVINDVLATIDEGSFISLSYRSPSFTEDDATVVKLYNNIYIRSNGVFTFDCYIDDVKVCTNELSGDKIFDIKVPQEKQRGSSISFAIQGVGVVKEIEYKTVGRNNGR